MTGTKFLSDVLDMNQFEKGQMNVIYAPCGCGKTTCAINRIATLASSPKKAIYLIDTRIGKERLSRENKMASACVFIDDPEKNNLVYLPNDEKIVVMTYALFGLCCSQIPNFAAQFEVIICDEPQNLVLFSKIGTKNATDIPFHKIARSHICETVRNGKVLVVAITATPKPLEELDCELKSIRIDRTDLRKYEERQIIHYARPEDVLNAIPLGKRGGLYVKHITPLVRYADILRDRGFHPLMLWSTTNSAHPLDASQLAARQYIIENESVPDEYNVFLFNATAETSINIRSHMDFFIAHDTNQTPIAQSRGRYRGDLETLYIFDRNSPYAVSVPDEYLNRTLFRKDLSELRNCLNLVKDKKGHLPSIDDMLRIISSSGYVYEQGIKNRKQTFTIRKA